MKWSTLLVVRPLKSTFVCVLPKKEEYFSIFVKQEMRMNIFVLFWILCKYNPWQTTCFCTNSTIMYEHNSYSLWLMLYTLYIPDSLVPQGWPVCDPSQVISWSSLIISCQPADPTWWTESSFSFQEESRKSWNKNFCKKNFFMIFIKHLYRCICFIFWQQMLPFKKFRNTWREGWVKANMFPVFYRRHLLFYFTSKARIYYECLPYTKE